MPPTSLLTEYSVSVRLPVIIVRTTERENGVEPHSNGSIHDARTGADRILDAAVDLFGRDGVTGTSLKAIAAAAGVSQALVVHHFGSKEGLRRACDHYVARSVRASKEASIAAGPGLDPFHALRHVERSQPLLRYLARALTEGGDQARALVDEFVADAEQYLARAEADGLVKPSREPRERTILLVIWSMGALAMHDHVKRLLGVDFLSPDDPPESMTPYLRPALELLSQGLFVDGAFDGTRT